MNKEPKDKEVPKENKLLKNKKQLIIILSIVVIIALVIIVVLRISNGENLGYIKEDEYGVKINESERISESKKLEDLDIVDVSLIEEDNVSKFEATIQNNTDKEQGGYNIEIIFLDKKGNEITRMSEFIDKIQPGEKLPIMCMAQTGFVKAYDYRVEKLEEPEEEPIEEEQVNEVVQTEEQVNELE